MIVSRRLSLAVVPLLAIVAGCAGGEGPITADRAAEAKLADVGELCRIYQKIHKGPPKTIKDLTRGGGQATPAAFAALSSGAIVLRYEASLPSTDEEPGEPSDEVLAYLKKVPQDGGPVLMLDRRIRMMTAEQFKAAKLAGKG